MTLYGKGMYIWQIPQCEGGSPAQIAATAKAAGLSHVLIKIADGVLGYNHQFGDLAKQTAAALQADGITVYGWQYAYSYDPEAEAEIAIQRIAETGVTGFVIDAEEEYKRPGAAASATAYMTALRQALPNLPMALSTYRYPTLHPQLPYVAFLSQCDFSMPQVYWMYASNPAYQLTRCCQEYAALPVVRPVLPTGAAWKEGGWAVMPGQALEFLTTAQALGLTGANFWDWQHCRKDLPAVWAAIAGYVWDGEPPEPPEPAALEALAKVNVNLRTGPGTSYPIIGSVKAGAVETIINLEGSTVWVKVAATDQHPAGWAAYRYNGSHYMEIV